jgi:hypothetical protein
MVPTLFFFSFITERYIMTASTVNRPSIDYAKTSRSYYLYNGTIQSTKDSPTSTFKHAIQQALGETKLPDDCKKLMQAEKLDDMPMRWFLLNTLYELKSPLKLYSCFDDADAALSRMSLI